MRNAPEKGRRRINKIVGFLRDPMKGVSCVYLKNIFSKHFTINDTDQGLCIVFFSANKTGGLEVIVHDRDRER